MNIWTETAWAVWVFINGKSTHFPSVLWQFSEWKNREEGFCINFQSKTRLLFIVLAILNWLFWVEGALYHHQKKHWLETCLQIAASAGSASQRPITWWWLKEYTLQPYFHQVESYAIPNYNVCLTYSSPRSEIGHRVRVDAASDQPRWSLAHSMTAKTGLIRPATLTNQFAPFDRLLGN